MMNWKSQAHQASGVCDDEIPRVFLEALYVHLVVKLKTKTTILKPEGSSVPTYLYSTHIAKSMPHFLITYQSAEKL